MTTTDIEKDETADAGVGSSGASLEIELHASGRTEKIRLSCPGARLVTQCTYARLGCGRGTGMNWSVSSPARPGGN